MTRIEKSFMICVLICLTIMIYYFPATYIVKTTDSLLGPVRQRSRCDYVGFEIPKTGNRLGNYLFYYSAVMYVAWLTGRRPCIWTKSTRTLLDRVFDVAIQRVDVTTLACPLYRFTQHKVGVYDRRVESLVGRCHNESLLLKGFFQSWKYAEPVAEQLRQHLAFRRELVEFVAEFLTNSVPMDWNGLEFVRVGIHVRRGDFLRARARHRGFTVADERYLQRAMRHFVRRFPRVQFLVVSNDIHWCQQHISLHGSGVNVTYSTGHDTGQDLALLASCDHTVMTTGTYSWWAAWLANGITIYYANYPRRGSWLSTQMYKNDYYHPKWIGIDDT